MRLLGLQELLKVLPIILMHLLALSNMNWLSKETVIVNRHRRDVIIWAAVKKGTVCGSDIIADPVQFCGCYMILCTHNILSSSE